MHKYLPAESTCYESTLKQVKPQNVYTVATLAPC